jgi:hypothetical protein
MGVNIEVSPGMCRGGDRAQDSTLVLLKHKREPHQHLLPIVHVTSLPRWGKQCLPASSEKMLICPLAEHGSFCALPRTWNVWMYPSLSPSRARAC